MAYSTLWPNIDTPYSTLWPKACSCHPLILLSIKLKIVILSTLESTSLDEIIRCAPKWFILIIYIYMALPLNPLWKYFPHVLSM